MTRLQRLATTGGILIALAFIALLWAQSAVDAQIAAGTVNIRTLPKGATTAGNPTSHAIDADTQALAVILKGTNTVQSTQAGLSTLTTGQQSVTASAVVLPTVSATRVCIKVLAGGTQVVYYGPTGVTTSTGMELSPGDAACMPASNLNKVFVIAGGTGSTVAYEVWN